MAFTPDPGKALKPDRAKPVVIPTELEQALAKDRRAKTAFDDLTKGRRRECAEYLDEAKRDATRQSRVEKVMPMILAGVGLNDKYRK